MKKKLVALITALTLVIGSITTGVMSAAPLPGSIQTYAANGSLPTEIVNGGFEEYFFKTVVGYDSPNAI